MTTILYIIAGAILFRMMPSPLLILYATILGIILIINSV